jgi:PAS domain S-box-containing protein
MLTWLGLRARLVLLVLAALLPVMGLLAYSAVQSRRAAFELAGSQLNAHALLMAAHEQELVGKASDVLKSIASGPSVKAVMPALRHQYISNLQVQHPEFAQLGVLGLDGKLVCSSTAAAEAQDFGQAEFFKSALEGKMFSVGHYGELAQGIGFGMPVYNPLGQLSGVAFAVFELQALAKSQDHSGLLPGAAAMLLDHHATVLTTYPPASGLQGHVHPDRIVQQAVQIRQQGVQDGLDAQGAEQIYAFAPVPGGGVKGMMVAVSVPRALVAAQSDSTVYLHALAMLAMMALGVAGTWRMGGRLIVSPAVAILKETQALSRGDLSARVSMAAQSQDEIGQIGLAFNQMAESLQAHEAQLDAALRLSGKERALLDLTLNSMSDGVIAVDTDGRFLLFNACAAKFHGGAPLAGSRLSDWCNSHELLMLDGKTAYPLHKRPLAMTLRGIALERREVLFRRAGQPERVLKVSAKPLYDASRQLIGGAAVYTDITERKAAENFTLAQNQVLGLIAEGAALPDALKAIVQLIEQSSPGSWCSILQVCGELLCDGVSISLAPDFVQAVDGLPIGEGRGACGTAAFRKESVVVEDVSSDPLMQDYLALALAHGLHACWSAPVISNSGEVLATFAIYRQTPGRPQPADQELIASGVRLARIALERAHAQVALVSSEARFRELAENIDDVFYNFDAQTHTMLYISPGYEKLWGRSCESLYANPASLADTLLPEDLPVLAVADQLKAQGKRCDVEYRILLSDGQMRWIRDRSYPVHNAAGALERIVGIARDITESKRAKLALAATNRALQMLSCASIAINRIGDEAGLLAEICRVAVEVGGYRMAWVGYAQNDDKKSFLPVAHAGEETGYLDGIEVSWDADQISGQGPIGQAVRSGKSVQRPDISKDTKFCRRDAALERGYRSLIALPMREAGRSFGVLSLYRDKADFFTDDEVQLLQELADSLAFGIVSLRSQAAARQSASKLREQASLLDRAQDAIMVRNLDNTLRFWNEGAQRLYGWRADEVLGQTMDALMFRSPEMLASSMSNILENGDSWNCELDQLARDGSVVHVESRSTVVRDEQGQITGVLSINTDIGERMRAHQAILSLNATLEERVLRRTAQLELANQQLESFSYSVSHDLRSPLNAIDGFSHLLQKNMLKLAATDPLAERSAHYLARIRNGIGQMGELIDAMLSLAQVSRSSLRWDRVDLSALAQSLLASYQERDPTRQVRCHVEPGLLAQGDARLLKQVLDNLLGNAWKFTAGQACAEITLSSEAGPTGEPIYVVRDNGAGFDMAYASKLFGAFQRLHAQTEFAGTGVGLATVARIVERHGGKIWAEAAPGEGARFSFTLGARAA